MSLSPGDDSTVPMAHYPPMTNRYMPVSIRTSTGISRDPTTNTSSANSAISSSDDAWANDDSVQRKAVLTNSQVRFCQPDLLATINCVDAMEPDERYRIGRKLGPVLLDLRRIVYGENGKLFQYIPICRSRGNPSLGTSVSSTCLDVGRSSAGPLPTAVTGLTTGAVCIHSFPEQTFFDEDCTPVIEYYHMPRNHRPSTAVVWRPGHTHVALGLTGAGAMHGHHQYPNAQAMTTRRPVVAPGRGVPGDREYCCFVWDVEHQSGNRRKTSPLFKLSHQSGVESLGWLFEGGQTLLVGGQLRNLQLYDLRESGTNMNPPVTVHAHNYGVHVQVNPVHDWQMVTYCKVTNEPVKLWDARRMDSPITELKLAISSTVKTNDASFAQQSGEVVVSSVKWVSTGILAIAVDNEILEYDTSASGSRPIHFNTINVSKPVLDFEPYPFSRSSDHANRNIRAVKSLFSNRIAVIDGENSIGDVARLTVSPLAISKRDGRLVHGLGHTLWIGSTQTGPTAMERAIINTSEDMSATMMRRALCLSVGKYAMDASSNIKMLASEIQNKRSGNSLTRESLLRLWTWIRRVEDLCCEEDSSWNDTEFRWSAKSLVDTGAWDLLQMGGPGASEMKTYSEELACTTFESRDRRNAMASCGWAGKADLTKILAECEAQGEYERSAALAVWHGDIGAAVDATQRGADYVRLKLASVDGAPLEDARMTLNYAETLALVSVSIAGFRGGDSESTQSGIWRRSCTSLLQRPELSTDSPATAGRAAYLRCTLRFLLSIGITTNYQEVLGDSTLSLCDRVAFACRFFERNELKKSLEKWVTESKEEGNLEGLTITGLSKDGISILQSYVDQFADVQTATLVTSRVIFPVDWTAERRVCAEWLEAYRSLLNIWQMWQSRAIFDVDRAELLRHVKTRQLMAAGPNTGGGNKLIGGLSRGRGMQGRRSGMRMADPDVQVTVPSQLDARCNYCNSPLGLRSQDSTANQWLSKMKPVLSCCPQCRKPLPRCSICMLSLGTLNPFMELTKERPRSGRGPSDDIASLGNLPFAEWFTWCIRCKHGGHAHHLLGWFSKHTVCPVSDCNCHCQFDGIQRLKRPALTNLVSGDVVVECTD